MQFQFETAKCLSAKKFKAISAQTNIGSCRSIQEGLGATLHTLRRGIVNFKLPLLLLAKAIALSAMPRVPIS